MCLRYGLPDIKKRYCLNNKQNNIKIFIKIFIIILKRLIEQNKNSYIGMNWTIIIVRRKPHNDS